MLRHRGLSKIELIDYPLGNLGLTLDELLENPDPRRVCERLGDRSNSRPTERSRFRVISQIANRGLYAAHPTSLRLRRRPAAPCDLVHNVSFIVEPR